MNRRVLRRGPGWRLFPPPPRPVIEVLATGINVSNWTAVPGGAVETEGILREACEVSCDASRSLPPCRRTFDPDRTHVAKTSQAAPRLRISIED